MKPETRDDGARRQFEWTDLGSSPVKAPALPGARRFSAQTRAWYKAWTEAPQASQFIGTDWLTLHMLAPLVDAYFAEPSPAKMAEIRQAHSKLGATVDDRMRLRLRVSQRGQPPAEAAGTPAEKKAARTRRDPRLSVVQGG